ncbi:MAG TPA: DUF983 domain-containing protein, partial [Flavobacterium sp.]|nr:DUF983 domain-containing protein [Flavobacterium sp.]
QSESMYISQNPYNVIKTLKLRENCSKCGLKYQIEPNFFFGAMYVSYAAAVAVGMAIFLVAHFAFEASLNNSFIAIIVGLLVLMPWIARISRNIYINLFVNYRGEPKNDL